MQTLKLLQRGGSFLFFAGHLSHFVDFLSAFLNGDSEFGLEVKDYIQCQLQNRMFAVIFFVRGVYA
jgi:hypothetical protein